MTAAPREAGSVIGRRYRLERELSTQGGMGVVWTAIHLVTKRRVAIKLLRGSGNEDAASRARLIREARASCAVEHPSVLPVLDVIDADGAPALVMELLEGESLRERLSRKGPLGVRETCTLLAPVAEALAAAHAARIVHRDVKPENIFLVGAPSLEPPSVKVLDFGIAKIVATEEATTSLTESGAMLGTPYYMAPEQAFGERDVGPAADAWSLGIVLYECLAGARPTQADNLGQVIKRITQEPIVPIEEVVAGVPADLARVIGRLLVRDLAQRETDLGAVAKTLRACVGAEGAEGADEDTRARPRRDRRARLWITALVVIAGAGAAYLANGFGRHGPPPVPVAATDSSVAAAAVASEKNVIPVVIAGPVTAIPAVADAGAVEARSQPTPTPTPTPTSASRITRPAVSVAIQPRADANEIAADDAGTTGPGHVIIKTPF